MMTVRDASAKPANPDIYYTDIGITKLNNPGSGDRRRAAQARRGALAASGSRLEARGSGLGARGSRLEASRLGNSGLGTRLGLGPWALGLGLTPDSYAGVSASSSART